MNILGINPGYDATAALLKNGQIAGAIGEERLSRIKGHLGFPYRAVRRLLETTSTGPEEIDLVVFPFHDYLRASNYFTRFILDPEGGHIDFANELSFPIRWSMTRRAIDEWMEGPEKLMKRYEAETPKAYRRTLDELGLECPFRVVDHHMAHSASAFYTSGLDQALILTSDGSGDGNSATLNVGTNGTLKRLLASPAAHSAGVFYAAITKFLGFKRHRHEGKITGLAAYGCPETTYPVMKECLTLTEDVSAFRIPLPLNGNGGSHGLRNCLNLLRRRQYWGAYTNALLNFLESRLKGYAPEDIAAGAQKRLEDCFVTFLTHAVEQYGKSPVIMAGGTFANVRLNQKLMECPGVERVYIHPNMGDGGTALGAALHEWVRIRKEMGALPKPSPLDNVYIGPTYSTREMEEILRTSSLKWTYCRNIEREIALKVAENNVVARFNGAMEYGPRALGNRSILVSPKDPTVNEWLNNRLNRTEFMPFAPAVIEKEAHHYFHGTAKVEHPCTFMTITLDATDRCKKEAPAIVHVDGTARPQFVNEASNRSFYRILKDHQNI
ncbi:MAG: carbamoyltransferase C-terminal domain-containing protein, partial [Pseudomonadota bacterium]